MKTKVNEFEINKDKLRKLLGDMVVNGVYEGDNWWLPTEDNQTIKLIVKESKPIKSMTKTEKTIRKQIADEIEGRLNWRNAPVQIRGAVNRTAKVASDIARGVR